MQKSQQTFLQKTERKKFVFIPDQIQNFVLFYHFMLLQNYWRSKEGFCFNFRLISITYIQYQAVNTFNQQFEQNVMKKMNRSQSSYRPGKTLLTQACDQNLMNKYASRNYPPRNHIDGAYNDIDANKENSSLFQSISQRNFVSKSRQQISQFDIGQDLNKKVYKKGNLKEQDLVRSRDQRDYFSKNYDMLNISKGYKYSQGYYQSQIQSLREIIRQKDRELQSYKIQSSSKSDDLDSMAEEMSSKIQRDNKEKNMYIRQLNATVIQKNSLQERFKIHRAEIQTLKLCIDQKDKALKQFEEKLGQVDMKKKKVQQYDYQIKEYHQMLNQLQLQIQKLREERQAKEYTIQEKGKFIFDLQQTIGSYEDKLRSIQESLIRITEDKKQVQQKNQQLKRECLGWKSNYDEQLKKSQLTQEYQRKIKTYQQSLQEAGRRIMQLTSQNQKNKITITTYEKSLEKCKDIERQMSNMRKQLKEKDEKLMQSQLKQKKLRQLQDFYLKVSRQKDELLFKLQEKSKQCKNLMLQVEQHKNRADLFQQDLKQMQQNNNRMRQRGQKMQVLMKENNRLTSSLHQKIDQIEKLQIKINNMDIKLNDRSIEISKLKQTIYEYQQEISQVKLEVQDLRERYQIQTNSRMLNQDKVLRCNQQIFAHKFTITKLQTQNKDMVRNLQQLNLDHFSEINNFKQTLTEISQDKIQSQQLLEQAKLRLEFLQNEVEQCKVQISQSQAKQRQHKQTASRLEQNLVQLRESNQILRQQKDQIIEKCQQLKQIHNFVMSFQSR